MCGLTERTMVLVYGFLSPLGFLEAAVIGSFSFSCAVVEEDVQRLVLLLIGD